MTHAASRHFRSPDHASRRAAWQALAFTVCGAIATLGAQSASAADQVLDFKLVTRPVDVKALDHKAVDGQSVGTGKYFGVANFKDGRTASKDFIFSWDFNKGNGPFFGYSTYTFEDGSSITARFAGTLRAGQPMHGEYTIVSGSGVYAGAKGSGVFDAMPHKLAEGNLYSGRLMVTTP